MSDRMIYSIDIGNSKVNVMVGCVDNLTVMGLGSFIYQDFGSPNFIQNGIITDMVEAKQKIKNCLLQAQIQADCTAGGVIINCSGININYLAHSVEQQINGKTVTTEIIANMEQQAKKHVQEYHDHEIVHFNTQDYLIDGMYIAKNPLSIMCKNIKGNYNLVLAQTMLLANLKQLIPTDFTVETIIPTAILSSQAALNAVQFEQGACCIDIGYSTTNLAVYKNNVLQFYLSIPFGGSNITAAIANRFKLSMEVAEDIKVTKGLCRKSKDKFDDGNFQVVDYSGVIKTISKSVLAEIISTKLKELFNYINLQIVNAKLSNTLFRGFVLTGGVANTDGICSLAEDILNNSVVLSRLEYNGDYRELVNQNVNATSIGGLIYAKKMMEQNYLVSVSQVSSLWANIKKRFILK
jgi:cell division protein FtsA